MLSRPPIQPQTFAWDSEAKVMTPINVRLAERQYEAGGIYRLAVLEDRSDASHKHFFACIADGWANLPERWDGQFQSTEALRKYLLIKIGHANREAILCGSSAEADRMALFFKRTLRADFAIVEVEKVMVTVWTAKSIAVRAVNRQEFQKIKSDCLDRLADMLGTSVEELAASAGQAA